MNNRKKITFISTASIIAALYFVLTYVTSLLGLASGVIQCRLSESLLVLSMFTPAAIPGLFAGCTLSNLLMGCVIWDIIFGSIATLIGATGAYILRNKNVFAATSVNVVSNALIVPLVLKYAYALDGGFMFFVATVGIGEIISCTLLGAILYKSLLKYKLNFFKN